MKSFAQLGNAVLALGCVLLPAARGSVVVVLCRTGDIAAALSVLCCRAGATFFFLWLCCAGAGGGGIFEALAVLPRWDAAAVPLGKSPAWPPAMDR